jgi:magnesium-dependent phosphatase 1
MLIVFDLDFTLWDCGGTWCDHTLPPYKKLTDNLITDSAGRKIKLYPETIPVLEYLKMHNIHAAVASRTGEPNWARQLLNLFNINQYFEYQEIYPGSKIGHLHSIKKNSGIPFNEMYFFDDEYRNIDEVKALGVNCYFVGNGITASHIGAALSKFRQGST